MSIAQDIETKCKTLIEAATAAAGYAPRVIASVAPHDAETKDRESEEVYIQCTDPQPIKEFASLGFCDLTITTLTSMDDDKTGEVMEAIHVAAVATITAGNLDGISTTHTVAGIDDSQEPQQAPPPDAEARVRMKANTFRVATVRA